VIEFTRGDQRIPDHGVLPTPKTWDYAPTYEEVLAKTGDERWARVCGEDLAFSTCPLGHTCRISRKIHSVSPDGTLSPSYVCPGTGCTFHDYVQFVGWATRKTSEE